MLPDPAELDAIARSIAAHADTARTRAARLVHAAHCAGWHGSAAAAFALTADDAAHALRLAAGRLDDAAAALHRHARAVEHLLCVARAMAVRTEHGLEDLAGDAASLVGDIGSLVGV